MAAALPRRPGVSACCLEASDLMHVLPSILQEVMAAPPPRPPEMDAYMKARVDKFYAQLDVSSDAMAPRFTPLGGAAVAGREAAVHVGRPGDRSGRC